MDLIGLIWISGDSIWVSDPTIRSQNQGLRGQDLDLRGQNKGPVHSVYFPDYLDLGLSGRIWVRMGLKGPHEDGRRTDKRTYGQTYYPYVLQDFLACCPKN